MIENSLIEKLREDFLGLCSAINRAEIESKKKELELESADPNLWDNQEYAQKITSALSRYQTDLDTLVSIENGLRDLSALFELSLVSDEDELKQLDSEAGNLYEKLINKLTTYHTRVLLSGEYDNRSALLTVRAGAGGIDAADWASMVLRMYVRWAEQKKYQTQILDISYAEEAGIKSATMMVKSDYAYGILSVEMGTHRLVRISPFDNQSRRHTSFAEVEVIPVVETTDQININEADVRVDTFHSSGPGGQSVNTTDSAVRLTHKPSGIVVSCQNEKSQLQNKVAAFSVLQAKLLEKKRQEEKEELDAMRGDGSQGWGNQMRSYVLHPYQMVKDVRSGIEVGNPSSVLDGNLDIFLDAAIQKRALQESSETLL